MILEDESLKTFSSNVVGNVSILQDDEYFQYNMVSFKHVAHWI
jgi:hypothetical protein